MNYGAAPNDSREAANLDRFLLLMIHDLRAPLRQGMLRAQLLERSAAGTMSGESEAHLLAVLQAHRLSDTFLTRLAEYCQAGSGSGASPRVGIDVLLQNAVRTVGVDPEVGIEIDDVPECPVPSSVQKVFVELLDNARKFPRGPVSIRVAASCNESECIFEVRDNGIGFESRFAETLWEPLQRLNGIGVFPGFGFGLAISRRIISGIQGRTWANSIDGKGSSFFFSIPCCKLSAFSSWEEISSHFA